MGWNGPMTHRQFMAWMHWLNDQWNQPSRTDHYLMQISADVRRANAKNPRAVKTENSKIKFLTGARPKTHHESLDDIKMRWGAFVGAPPPPEALSQRPDEEGEEYRPAPMPDWQEYREEESYYQDDED